MGTIGGQNLLRGYFGGRFRDRILCYADTDTVPSGKEMGKRLRKRMEQGFKFLKMDIGVGASWADLKGDSSAIELLATVRFRGGI